MIHWLSTAFSTYLLHTEHANGYQFWSGIGGKSLGGAIVLGYLRHHNCHHKGCPRPGHQHPDHGWPACKGHWNERPDHVKRDG